MVGMQQAFDPFEVVTMTYNDHNLRGWLVCNRPLTLCGRDHDLPDTLRSPGVFP